MSGGILDPEEPLLLKQDDRGDASQDPREFLGPLHWQAMLALVPDNSFISDEVADRIAIQADALLNGHFRWIEARKRGDK